MRTKQICAKSHLGIIHTILTATVLPKAFYLGTKNTGLYSKSSAVKILLAAT